MPYLGLTMRQPDSVSKNPTISDQLRLRKPSIWPDWLDSYYLLLAGFSMFLVFDTTALESFFDNALRQGPVSFAFWMFLAALSALTWLIADILPTVFNQRPKQYRKQRMPVWVDCLKAIIAGVRLSTVKPQQLNLKGNQFSKNFPDYWEVLVEEHRGVFYGRFFVNMR